MSVPHTTQKRVKEGIPIEQEVWDGHRKMPALAFCDENCEDGYKTDQRYGLIQGPVLLEFDSGNSYVVGFHDGTLFTHTCGYCDSDLPEPQPIDPLAMTHEERVEAGIETPAMGMRDPWLVERNAGYAYGVDYRNHLHYGLHWLKCQRTLNSGHFDNLKVEEGKVRVWLSRMTRADGAPYDNQVIIEIQNPHGDWKQIDAYKAHRDGPDWDTPPDVP